MAVGAAEEVGGDVELFALAYRILFVTIGKPGGTWWREEDISDTGGDRTVGTSAGKEEESGGVIGFVEKEDVELGDVINLEESCAGAYTISSENVEEALEEMLLEDEGALTGRNAGLNVSTNGTLGEVGLLVACGGRGTAGGSGFDIGGVMLRSAGGGCVGGETIGGVIWFCMEEEEEGRPTFGAVAPAVVVVVVVVAGVLVVIVTFWVGVCTSVGCFLKKHQYLITKRRKKRKEKLNSEEGGGAE